MKRKGVSLLVTSITGYVLVAALMLTASPALAAVIEEIDLIGPPTDSDPVFELLVKLSILGAASAAEAKVD